MSLIITKAGHITFEHSDGYTGEVIISRGEKQIAVPFDALRKLVAEAVRHEAIQRLQEAKTDALLRRAL